MRQIRRFQMIIRCFKSLPYGLSEEDTQSFIHTFYFSKNITNYISAEPNKINGSGRLSSQLYITFTEHIISDFVNMFNQFLHTS